MGCAHSTVKDQVQDTAAAPVADAAAPEAVAAVAEETTETVATETPAEEQVAADESSAAPAAVEEAAPAEEAAAVVETESVAAEAASVEKTDEAPAAEEESVAAVAVEEEKEVTATPVVTEEEAAPGQEVAAATAEVTPAEPETEAAPVADESKESGLVFTSTGVSFGDKGVAYYNFIGSNAEDPAQDVKISKRFNDFKALHAEIAAIMANEANVAPEHQDKFKTYPALPSLPKTSLFRGRSNAKQTEEREAQFLKILNAIARHPIAADSAKFKAFLA